MKPVTGVLRPKTGKNNNKYLKNVDMKNFYFMSFLRPFLLITAGSPLRPLRFRLPCRDGIRDEQSKKGAYHAQ
jgi:hypothetical protein